MPYEYDDLGLRIIGYNEPIEFYDPDRDLQATIYLQEDNTLNIGSVEFSDANLVMLDGRYLKLDCSNDPLTDDLQIQGHLNLNAAGAELRIEGDHALSLEDSAGARTNVLAGASVGDSSAIATSTVIGYRAAYQIDSVNDAVLIGHEAGTSAAIGDVRVRYSTVIGYHAGYHITYDEYHNPYIDHSDVIGHEAAAGSGLVSYSVVMGHQAAYETQPSSSVIIGERAAYQSNATATSPDQAIIIGSLAAYGSDRIDFSIVIGEQAALGAAGYEPTLLYSVVVGNRAAQYIDEMSYGVAVGWQAHYYTSGSANVAVGEGALYATGAGVGGDTEYIVAVGQSAMSSVSNGAQDVVAVGVNAGVSCQYIETSVLIGSSAGSYSSEADLVDVVAVGAYALAGTSGARSEAGEAVALGYGAAYRTVTYGSTVIGYHAGSYGTLAQNSVLIGHQAGYQPDTIGSVLIGYQAGYGITQNNVLVIENSVDIATPLIYGEFDNDLVRINGDAEIMGHMKTVLTNGSAASPELIFSGGDVILG